MTLIWTLRRGQIDDVRTRAPTIYLGELIDVLIWNKFLKYATRNGQHGLQWADAPPFSRMCSCALNSSCNHGNMCNCDSGRDGIDEGYNTHAQLLPVMQLYVGGTNEWVTCLLSLSVLVAAPNKFHDISRFRYSSANITIGPLKCSRRRESLGWL